MTTHRIPWLRRSGTATVLAAMFVGGCGRTGNEAVDRTRPIATQFLDELRAGHFEPAWQGCSTEFKSLMGVGSLRDYVKTHPALKVPAEFSEIRTIDRDGRGMAECVFQATPKVRGKPSPATIKVLLAAGEDGWKVEHLTVE